MSTSATALLVVDVQESFRRRPYWRDSDVPLFIECLRSLIEGAQFRKIPVIQIFHVEDSGPFSLQSGYVVPLHDLSFTPDAAADLMSGLRNMASAVSSSPASEPNNAARQPHATLPIWDIKSTTSPMRL
jgi:nicotinamidase-related amidase